MTYRVAAGLLAYLLPVETSTSPETLRSQALKAGEQLCDAATVRLATVAPTISISLDPTFIRSCHEGERPIEVRVGNVETPGGGRQVFGAVAKSDTDILELIGELIGRTLETMGRTRSTRRTAFTDGCSGLRSILTNAGVTSRRFSIGCTSRCVSDTRNWRRADWRMTRRTGGGEGPYR
jgi:hypothetical protein